MLRCETVVRRASRSLHFAQPGFALRTRERAAVLALCGEEAQHVRLPRARDAPRGLGSLHPLWKDTAPAKASLLGYKTVV